jgi:SNF2 family DNA or RNA helicase
MQLSRRLRQLRAAVRVIISGTPIQNHLGDLHALLDFAAPGLLGTARVFKQEFEKPIAAGSDRKASERVRQLAAAKAAELRALVAPYVLRREKREVLGGGGEGGGVTTDTPSDPSVSDTGSSSTAAGGPVVGAAAAAAGSGQPSRSTAAVKPGQLPPKDDLVVWLRLAPLQQHVYELFLHSDAVRAALNSSRSPLAALTVLKKVCDHPALLSQRAAALVMSGECRDRWGSGGVGHVVRQKVCHERHHRETTAKCTESSTCSRRRSDRAGYLGDSDSSVSFMH